MISTQSLRRLPISVSYKDCHSEMDPSKYVSRSASSQPQAKRPKWSANPNACDVCRKRKTKCRVTKRSGACDRCIETVQACSLYVRRPDGSDSQGEGDEDIEALGDGGGTGSSGGRVDRERGQTDVRGLTIDNRRILVRLDQRTKDLEIMVRHLTSINQQMSHHPLPSDGFANRDFHGEREDGVGDDDDMEESVQELLGNLLGTSLLYVTGMNLHDHTVFLDPVGAGLMSMTSMDALIERYDPIETLSPMSHVVYSAPHSVADTPQISSMHGPHIAGSGAIRHGNRSERPILAQLHRPVPIFHSRRRTRRPQWSSRCADTTERQSGSTERL